MGHKFPPRAIELIYDQYGTYEAKAIATRIASETGMRFAPRSIIAKAHALGLRVRDAQGYISIGDAANLLGVPKPTVYNHLRLNGYRLIGQGAYRFITQEAFEQLQRVYPPLPAPSLGLAEVCRRLCYSRTSVITLIHSGRLRAVKRGSFWFVPVSEVERFLSEQKRQT